MTPQDVADVLRVSTDTVMRWFSDREGVIDLGSPEDLRGHKRRYRVLRIPRVVFERFIQENRVEVA
jgi:hypothetical protein